MPEMPSLVLGIDPGQSGGIAAVGPIGGNFIDAAPMPETEADIAELLRYYKACVRRCYIEHVHSFPGQGVASSFKFGRSYGLLRGLLIGLQIPFEEVSPQKWTKAVGCVGGMPGTEKKNMHKARAQQLFPSLKITHATADALLIAEFGRRQ